VPAAALVDELVEHVLPELRRIGDDAVVVPGIDAVRRAGGGAERQRRLFARSATAADVVAELARETLAAP
jgi:carboxylate-amine ligase